MDYRGVVEYHLFNATRQGCKTMNLQNDKPTAQGGLAFRAVSSVLLLTATALLVGSLVTAHSVKSSPNSDRVTLNSAI